MGSGLLAVCSRGREVGTGGWFCVVGLYNGTLYVCQLPALPLLAVCDITAVARHMYRAL